MSSIPPPPLDDPSLTDPLVCPPLRWGLIGCGRISHDFTQALKLLPTAKVVSCSARSIDDAKNFAEKHGIVKYCKLKRLCSDVGIDSCKRGKELEHSIVQKRFSLTVHPFVL